VKNKVFGSLSGQSFIMIMLDNNDLQWFSLGDDMLFSKKNE